MHAFTRHDAVIRDLVFHLLQVHPWPWRVEIDWATTVQASDGTRVFGPPFQRGEPSWAVDTCHAIVDLAGEIVSKMERDDAEMYKDT